MNQYKRLAFNKIKHRMGVVKEEWHWCPAKYAYLLTYSSTFNTYDKKLMMCSWWVENKEWGFKKEESIKSIIKALFADVRIMRKLASLND